ncbi:MAG: transposase [Verrucomicrobiota bacterium]|nr:transposase [Verrucomicrobiota bacterium]
MPRRKRNWQKRACYHITHRCHDREFRFRFIKYREMYRKYLFEATKRFNFRVLDWMVTSNHVHLLITSGERGKLCLSEALQYIHGEVAQHYNLSKDSEGSFWSNRFYSTRIQSGKHLRRCLFYIDMNMVRAKAVSHPSEWRHGSWQEFMGNKRRYQIIDKKTLLNRLEFTDWNTFQSWYQTNLNEILLNEEILPQRDFWSQAAAVGDQEWLGRITKQLQMKRVEARIIPGNEAFSFKSFFLAAKNKIKDI